MLTTPEQISAFRIAVIQKAIDLYLRTGIRASRAYTPAAMRRAASGITGNAYNRSRKGLEQANADLVEVLERIHFDLAEGSV